jgi:hypothetical protein
VGSIKVIERFGSATISGISRGTGALHGNVIVVRLPWASAIVIHAILGITTTAIVSVAWCDIRKISLETHFFFVCVLFVLVVSTKKKKKFEKPNLKKKKPLGQSSRPEKKMENESQTKRKITPPEMRSPRRNISDAVSLPQPINETLSLEHFEQCLSTTTPTSPNSNPESNLFVKWLAERKK